MSAPQGPASPSDPKLPELLASDPNVPPSPLGEMTTGARGSASRSGGRKPLLTPDKDEKVTQLGLRESLVTGTPSYARPPNLRRTAFSLKLFGLLLLLILLMFGALVAGIYVYYQNNIEPRLALVHGVPVAPPKPEPAPAPVAKLEIPASVTDAIAEAGTRIAELQKQIDALRDTQAATESRLRELADRVAKPRTTNLLEIPTTPATEPKEEPTVVGAVPPASETNKELVLLKERNRLTAYADEAISTGSRKALDLLIENLQDPEMVNLRHATFAEIQRVYYHLRFTSRIDPNFKIPVNDLFKDPGIRDESDLKTEKVIELLHDQQQAWEVRLRAAWLLGGRPTREVGDALIKSIREDPVLDVAKEAQLSFEQNMNRKFLLLDLPAIEGWWESQTTGVRSEPLRKQEMPKK